MNREQIDIVTEIDDFQKVQSIANFFCCSK